MCEPLLIIVGIVSDSKNLHVDLFHYEVVLIQIGPFFFP